MTLLNATPRDTTAPTYVRSRIDALLARIGRLINGWIAAVIARHERKAALYVLRRSALSYCVRPGLRSL